jgi:RNA polymerase sigma-70 factor, ECF subfamily
MRPDQLEDYSSDEELLEKLIDLYGENIRKLSFTYVRSWAVAEDITQETFITCYRKMKDFRGESSYKTWIYKIAINKCKDFIKSKWFRFGVPFHLFKENFSIKTNSIEENFIEKEEDYILSKHVLSLPSKYRDVIIFYYYEELKIWEIEELTGIKQDTIKTRLRRAKEQLRKKLEGE